MKRLLLLILLPLAGCTLTPPIPLEENPDPLLAKLAKPLVDQRWDPPQLALAPIRTSYLGRHVVIPRAWTSPQLDTDHLQRRLQRVMSWGLHDWLPPEQRAKHDPWPLLLEANDPSLGAICSAAEDAGAQLVAQLDVLALRAAFVERELPWWPINAFLFWGIGVFPIVFVPDEEYEVELLATFRILDARTRKVLFPLRNPEREYRIRHRASFNDFQRGWSAESVFFLHEAFLVGSYEDFIAPYRELWPHVREKLLAAIVEDLREELPESLELEQDVLEKGDPGHARTFALIVAASDPNPPKGKEAGRPSALEADEDAARLRDLLVESGTARREDIGYVVHERNAGDVIRRELDGIGRRTRRLDRVIIYYSGFGDTDPEGRPRLVLDDGPLPLAELGRWCREALPRKPSVTFLLDTSLSQRRAPWGRNYRWERDPGNPAPREGFLDDLADPQLRWTVLAAAQSDEVASSNNATALGIFSSYLLRGLSGAADEDADGSVTLYELRDYVRYWVPQEAQLLLEGRQQTPVLRPIQAPNAVLASSPKKGLKSRVGGGR